MIPPRPAAMATSRWSRFAVTNLACFLLENLGRRFYFAWPDLEKSRRQVAQALDVEWYDPLVGK